jgi:ComF family protein
MGGPSADYAKSFSGCQLAMPGKVNGWLRNAQAWLMPPVCLLCHDRAEDCGLCGGCLADLPYHLAGCPRCGDLLTAGGLCAGCLEAPPPFDETVCLLRYRPPADALIQRLKFRGDLACARTLGILMAEDLLSREIEPPDVIVPVPLHRARLVARGYNQALELARPVARALAVPLDVRCCRRQRPTVEQASLAAAERRANVAGAFVIERPPARHVALVDDVMTTGHTLRALAAALKSSGAIRVVAWACARTV